MPKRTRKKAVVLLSGGMDSATVLALAVARGLDCIALSVDYGQLHKVELDAAKRLSHVLGATDHRVVAVDLASIGGSALTDPKIEVPTGAKIGDSGRAPVTYVPARNTILLSLALALAETIDSTDLFIGVNSVDYSGYPDCRGDFIAAYVRLANLATCLGQKSPIEVHAPLIDLSKADIVQLGVSLGVDFSMTISCYQAVGDGLACGRCDACRLRRRGFEEADIPDPTRYAIDGH